MDARVRYLTSELKRLDQKYFAQRMDDGRIFIMKKESFAPHSSISVCFPLTENWSYSGKPVDWGIQPIIWKLRYGDRGDELLKELDAERDQEERSKERQMGNTLRDSAEEMYYQAKHAWKDVNTGSMKKKDVKYGNY